jgi:hypothetical protein
MVYPQSNHPTPAIIERDFHPNQYRSGLAIQPRTTRIIDEQQYWLLSVNVTIQGLSLTFSVKFPLILQMPSPRMDQKSMSSWTIKGTQHYMSLLASDDWKS